MVKSKMLLANQMAGFLSFNMSKANRVIKLIFCIHLLKLQLDDMILDGRGQASPGMPKKAIKT